MAVIKDYGTLFVAVVALLQPWVVAIWKKYCRPGKIMTYETGYIEIGFSNYGPTIGLSGTIRCFHRELFLQKMQLLIERHKDKAIHDYDWVVFRSEKFSGDGPAILEIPHAFMINASLPKPYNILFNDGSIQKEIRNILNTLIEAWNKENLELSKEDKERINSQNQIVSANMRRSLYDKFSKSKEHVQAFTNINRLFYWEPGDYTLALQTKTEEPNRTHEHKWKFTIKDSDAELLRLNIITILNEACNVPSMSSYNFAYAEYQTTETI